MAEKVLRGGGGGGGGGERNAAKPMKLVVKRRLGAGGETPVKERLSWFMSSTESLEVGSVDTLKTGLGQKGGRVGGGGVAKVLNDDMEFPAQNDFLSSPESNDRLLATSPTSSTSNNDSRHLLLHIPTTSSPPFFSSSSSASLGFNIRGGSEYGLGIFVSRLDSFGLGRSHGLKVGDQILAVQEKSMEFASHACAVQVSSQPPLLPPSSLQSPITRVQ